MIKSFKEMAEVDVSKYVEEKKDLADKGKTFKYLPWEACLMLLHENGAENVYFYPVKSEQGSTLHMVDRVFVDKNEKKNSCYEVVVHIIIDDLEFDMTYPVISGSSVIHELTMNQQKVNTAVQRAFVKGVAIRTGLGISLWTDGNDETAEKSTIDDIELQDGEKLFRKLGALFATVMQRTGMSEEEVGARIGIDENPGAVIGQMCRQLKNYEAKLNELR